MATAAQGLAVAVRVARVMAIAVGAVTAFVTFASVVGVVTDSGWARGIAALLFGGGRAAGRRGAATGAVEPRAHEARPGALADVAAIALLAVGFVFVGVAEPVTRPLLVREGDRLAEEGLSVAAHAVYLLAGVRPVDPPATVEPGAPAPSAPSSSADGG